MLGPWLGFRGMFDDLDMSVGGPRVQVRESANAVRIELEVPRYRESDLRVDTDMDRGIITVTGTKASATDRAPEFEHLLFASEPMGSFRRSFNVSPQLYNIDGLSSSLADGVLTITVPKRQQQQQAIQQAGGARPQPVTLFGNREAAMAPATRKEMRHLHNARTIMSVRKVEDANNMLTYECDVAPFVTRDHIEINLLGRMLNIGVRYSYDVKRQNYSSSEQATYWTSVAVPEGTTANDVHTTFNEGKLTIKLDKHGQQSGGSPSAVPVKDTPPTQAQPAAVRQ